MKIKLDQTLKDVRGEVIREPDSEDALTLGTVCVRSLMGNYQDEIRTLKGEEKVRRYDLAMRLRGCDEIELPSEDVALIKDLIAKAFPTLVCGQAWHMIEGK